MLSFANAESLLRWCTHPCVLRCGIQSIMSTDAALLRLGRPAVAPGSTAAAPSVDAAVQVPLPLIGVAIDVAALCGAGGHVRRVGVVNQSVLWPLTSAVPPPRQAVAIVGEATFLGPRIYLRRRGGVVDAAVLASWRSTTQR